MTLIFLTVSFFLGATPTAAQTGPVATTDVASLLTRIEKIEKLQEQKPKDVWDKLAAISGIVSSVIVALIGFYAANLYNRGQKRREEERKDRELSLGQAETIEKFLPHLTSTDPRLRESALLIISTLLGDDIVTQLAAKLGGEGSAAALAQIASTSPRGSTQSVEVALGKVFGVIEPYVVRIAASDGQMMANGFFLAGEGLVVTPVHVADNLTPDVTLHTSRGDVLKGKVVYSNKSLGLAFIDVPEARGISGISVEAPEPTIGTNVVSLWHSPETGLRGEVGHVISTQAADGHTTKPAIAVTKFGSPGISGAPVVDSSGKLVGIAGFIYRSKRGHDPMTLLVPASSIAEALLDYRAQRKG